MKKRHLALALALVMTLLAPCGGEAPPEPAFTGAPETQGPEPTASPAPEWTSEGRPYRQSLVNTGADSTLGVFGLGGDYYACAMFFGQNAPSEYVLLKNGERFYTPESGAVQAACAGEGCIWLLESRETETGALSLLVQLSPEGGTLSELDLGALGLGEAYFSDMRSADGGVWLLGAGKAVLIAEGAVAAQLNVPAEAKLLRSGSGGACLVEYGGESAAVSALGPEGVEPLFTLDGTETQAFDGTEEFFLICADAEAAYGLDETGGKTPLIVWADCAIESSALRGLAPLGDGDFMMRSAVGLSRLSLTEPSEMPAGGELTLATLGQSSYLVQGFNAGGTGWQAREVDYSQGGALSAQDALTKLYADIAAGAGPDLLLLEGMPVESLARRGYLADIGELLEGDPEVSADDLVFAGRLGGGTYYVSDGFGIDTCAGLKSNFGEAAGWTPEEYLEAERALEPGAQMMYYVTRESFIRDAAQRYMQQAIDWQTGECSFDNAEFIALLETVGQITEHPETTEFTGYVPPEEELRTGKTYIETVRVANVAKLSEFEKAVGQELSFVGMPMPDGSNGSVMDPSSPVGVFAGSEKPDGCREFVKYLLLSYDMSYHRDKNSALPMYRPYLEKLEAEAVSEGRMTAEEVERFESFLASVENSTLVDETALGIICEEAAACFTGARTAAEAARIIQERLSIYVSEQS